MAWCFVSITSCFISEENALFFILKEQRKVIIEITIFICTTTMQAKYEYVYIKNDVEV